MESPKNIHTSITIHEPASCFIYVCIYVCLVYEYTNTYWRIRGHCLQKGIVEAEFRDTKDLCLICMFLN